MNLDHISLNWAKSSMIFVIRIFEPIFVPSLPLLVYQYFHFYFIVTFNKPFAKLFSNKNYLGILISSESN